MLWQRVLTALVLLPLMLGMLFYAPAGLWAFFTALMTLLALSEYSKLSGMNAEQRLPYLGGTALFMLFAAVGGWQLPSIAWLLVLLFWLIGMPLWLKRKWTLSADWKGAAVDWMLMLPFWFGMQLLRPDTDAATSLLAVMGLVWIADIFAYFSGKAYGKHKLAPAISPGKSWEGAFGGALAVLIYLTIVRQAGWLEVDASWFTAVLAALLLTAVSVGGDLLESWLKRAACVKDSSNLLPGHGGVFDRIDSLIAVISVYAAVSVLFG